MGLKKKLATAAKKKGPLGARGEGGEGLGGDLGGGFKNVWGGVGGAGWCRTGQNKVSGGGNGQSKKNLQKTRWDKRGTKGTGRPNTTRIKNAGPSLGP